MNKKNVVVSGIWYPVTMMGYFVRALQRRDDVNLVTAGPYTGNWIPWGGGMNVFSEHIHTPNLPLPYNVMNNISAGFIEKQLREDFVPDLWLSVDAGWALSTKPSQGMNIQIQSDPHVLAGRYQANKHLYDLSFCMQTPYRSPGDRYISYAYDPTLHYPSPEKYEDGYQFEYDVCLIGLGYDSRMQLINALRQKGLRVKYGLGIVYDEFRKEYNKSKLALSWSSMDDLPTRVFEAMGMDVPLVTNRPTDLSNLFVEGDHYLGFNTLPEAVSQVEWALSHYEEAKEMSANANRKVEAQHTWDIRIQQIFEECKL